MSKIDKISPFLWYDGTAEEAARLYVSLFEGSSITNVSPGPNGKAMSVNFELAGRPFMALNGGPTFKLNEAFSLLVRAESQGEVDTLWNALIANGGQESRCGWLKDPYGLSWQIVPGRFFEMTSDPDPARVGRVFRAMMGMNKFIVADLEKAYAGD
jgi:predicted 3-demethylubiquinone-9 3-methyltransferase (glyoxalase superfamily)